MSENSKVQIQLPDSYHKQGEDVLVSANGSDFQRGIIARRRIDISYTESQSGSQTLIGEWLYDVVSSTGDIVTVSDNWETYHSVVHRSGSILTCLQKSKGSYMQIFRVFDVPDTLLKSLYPKKEYVNYTPTEEDLENTNHLFK